MRMPKTADGWIEFARQDDCLDMMVPSDLRAAIMIVRTDERQRCANVVERALDGEIMHDLGSIRHHILNEAD